MSELESQADQSGAQWRVVVQHPIAPVAEAICTLLQQFRPAWKVEVGEVHQEGALRNVDALWVEGAYASQHALQAPMVWLAEDTSYSVPGIRQGILDYLLVPVDPSEVEASVTRVEEHWHARASHPSLLRISDSDSLAWREVVFFEASGNYTWAHLRGHTDPVLIGRNLKKLQSEVPADVFVRTHHSFVVNLFQVKHASFSGGWCKMEDEKQVPISDRKKELIRTKMAPFLLRR